MNIKLHLLICALIYFAQLYLEISETFARHEQLAQLRRQQKVEQAFLRRITSKSLSSFTSSRAKTRNSRSPVDTIKPTPVLRSKPKQKQLKKRNQIISLSSCRSALSTTPDYLITLIAALIKIAGLHFLFDSVNTLFTGNFGNRIARRLLGAFESGVIIGPSRQRAARLLRVSCARIGANLHQLFPTRLMLFVIAVQRASTSIAALAEEFNRRSLLQCRFLGAIPLYTMGLLALSDLSLQCSVFGLISEELAIGPIFYRHSSLFCYHFFLLYIGALTY